MADLTSPVFIKRITGSVGGMTSLLGTLALGYVDMTPPVPAVVTINMGLDTHLPPPGFLRALPGIVSSEWSFDPVTNKGYYSEQGATGPACTMCVDSDFNLHLYAGTLRPGQLVAIPPPTE